MEIKVGDKVYQRYRVGLQPRTKGGVVTEIDDDTATVKNIPWGYTENVKLCYLIKNKKQ